jgi:hypothetical protein
VTIDSGSVIAIATSLYGIATLLLVDQIRRDRAQRESHFGSENEVRKVNELRGAFYEAWGHWEGRRGSNDAPISAAYLGELLESLIRLECQLRLNSYRHEANDLGFAIRANFHDVGAQLNKCGIALGLLSPEYRHSSGQTSL